MDAWNTAIAEDSTRYGSGYTKKEFTFTRSEHLQLTEQQTIQALAQNAIQGILNNQSLPRVGITPTTEVRITFDLTVGRFVVWEPKAVKTGKSS